MKMKLLALVLGSAFAFPLAFADDKKTPPKATSTGSPADESELVEGLLKVRKEYQAKLAALYEHYVRVGDIERARWAEDELKSYHLMNKPSYRLDISDVPPPTLEAKVNVKEATIFTNWRCSTRARLWHGTAAELLPGGNPVQEILQKYPNCDKIADVAYELRSELYEGRAFKQWNGRAAAYYERAYQ
ncbi:MAG: hypothetical protein U0798_08405 [Gemmataceae bacterium]